MTATAEKKALGAFYIRLVGGYLDKLEQVATPGAVTEDDVDQPFRPKYTFTFTFTF